MPPIVEAVHNSLPVPATFTGPLISAFMPVAGAVVPMPTEPLVTSVPLAKALTVEVPI